MSGEDVPDDILSHAIKLSGTLKHVKFKYVKLHVGSKFISSLGIRNIHSLYK